MIRSQMADTCSHIAAVGDIKKPKKHECEECVRNSPMAAPSHVPELRRDACCDSSLNRHASKHARVSSHPPAASAELGAKVRAALACPIDTFLELRVKSADEGA
jgi:hypothetical protein